MIELVVVDAFAEAPFAGNPAAVTILDAFPPDGWMGAVAREMQLSETAFVVPRDDGDHDLRWFTPAAEVDLCGHATLAATHVLGGAARFHTRSGVLECRRGEDGWIGMDFPIDPPRAEPVGVALAGVTVTFEGRARFDRLIEVADPAWLRGYQPDMKAIGALETRCLILTAPGDVPGIDFISRFFAPAVGIPEDPVTGSAHCALAAHWYERTGRPALTGYQASPRGGTVRVRVEGQRVAISGRATTVSEVRMFVDPP